MKTITIQEIKDRLVKVESAFDAIFKDITTIELHQKKLEEQKTELTQEMFRLQGEKRFLEKVIKESDDTPPVDNSECKSQH